jgi:hypothetical protein
LTRFSLIAALCALAACSQPTRSYAPGVEANFMRACESRSAVQGFCACVWTKIQTNITPADFAALEQLSEPQRQANPVMQRMAGYQRECIAETRREPQTAP